MSSDSDDEPCTGFSTGTGGFGYELLKTMGWQGEGKPIQDGHSVEPYVPKNVGGFVETNQAKSDTDTIKEGALVILLDDNGKPAPITLLPSLVALAQQTPMTADATAAASSTSGSTSARLLASARLPPKKIIGQKIGTSAFDILKKTGSIDQAVAASKPGSAVSAAATAVNGGQEGVIERKPGQVPRACKVLRIAGTGSAEVEFADGSRSTWAKKCMRHVLNKEAEEFAAELQTKEKSAAAKVSHTTSIASADNFGDGHSDNVQSTSDFASPSDFSEQPQAPAKPPAKLSSSLLRAATDHHDANSSKRPRESGTTMANDNSTTTAAPVNATAAALGGVSHDEWWVVPRLRVRVVEPSTVASPDAPAVDFTPFKATVVKIDRAAGLVHVIDDDTKVPSAVPHSAVDTVIPTVGSRGLVVKGPMKGAMATVTAKRVKTTGPDGAVRVVVPATVKDAPVQIDAEDICALAA